MSEQEILQEVVDLIDEGVLIDRSPSPIRPTATVVASARGQQKKKGETDYEYEKALRVYDAGQFVREFNRKYPLGELVLSKHSPAERAAIEMAELLEVTCHVIEQGEKGAWDEDIDLMDERIVARASHVVALDKCSRSEHYQKLAKLQRKFFQFA